MSIRKRPLQYSGRPLSPESEEVQRILSKSRKQLKFEKTAPDILSSESNSSFATAIYTSDENIFDSPSSPEVKEMVYPKSKPIQIPLSPPTLNFGAETQSFLDLSPETEREPIQIPSSSATSDNGYETQNFFESIGNEMVVTIPEPSENSNEVRSTPSPVVSDIEEKEKVTQVYLPRAWKDRYSQQSLKSTIRQVVDKYSKSGTYLKMGGVKTKLKICSHGNMHFKRVVEGDEQPLSVIEMHLNFVK